MIIIRYAPYLFHWLCSAQIRRQRGVEEDDEPAAGVDRANSYGSGFLNSSRRKKGQVSLIDFLNE